MGVLKPKVYFLNQKKCECVCLVHFNGFLVVFFFLMVFWCSVEVFAESGRQGEVEK